MTRTLRDDLHKYISKINYDIGFYWWKRYIYCGFWSNISTPINLSITVLTALTTGQSATQQLVSAQTSTILGAIVLFISIFNTFFKPNDQLASNATILKKWQECGTEFEEIVYLPEASLAEQKIKLARLTELFKKTNTLKRDNQLTQCVDVLVYCVQSVCLHRHLHWISPGEIQYLREDQSQDNTVIAIPAVTPETEAGPSHTLTTAL